jgi:hypothetical protein
VTKFAKPVASAAMSTNSEMLPVPDALAQLADPVEVQVHPVIDVPTGALSATVAPVTSDGPKFVTFTVYVVDVPGVYVDESSFLLIARSATGVTVSVSDAELLPVFGSVVPAGAATVAVFVTLPLVAVTVTVTVISKNWPLASTGNANVPPWS